MGLERIDAAAISKPRYTKIVILYFVWVDQSHVKFVVQFGRHTYINDPNYVRSGESLVHPGLQKIAKAESPAALWRVVRCYFRDQGFGSLAYFVANRTGPSGGRKGFNIIHQGFTPEVKKAYIEEDWGSRDPGQAYVLAKGTPMSWMEIRDSVEADSDLQAFYDRMHEVGLGNGYSFPVFGPGGRNGCVTTGRPVDNKAIESAPLDDMHIFTQAAHMRLCQLLPDTPLQKPLSARELQILDWVARGKSNSVIADILDLSGATVDTYLRRIYDKLEVSDRTSAAVRGVGMGLIAA